MTNQTEHSEPKPCHTGEPEEDRVSVREASSVEPAMYVLLFIVFFTTLLAIRTVLDVNDSTKTVPDIIHSPRHETRRQRHRGGHRTIGDDGPDVEVLSPHWMPDPQKARRTLYQGAR